MHGLFGKVQFKLKTLPSIIEIQAPFSASCQVAEKIQECTMFELSTEYTILQSYISSNIKNFK